ncbi:uncharacterized protein LOC128864559 [Anastrepha ludens]|uniref:uncharacterized protein LOC128864559 n=1 Tax=Anastrepha ludens TaxID=28586 RepID=UPI0023AF9EBD|nr:uncharacterized protein LOC128864559 [Anastrepha ludens]
MFAFKIFFVLFISARKLDTLAQDFGLGSRCQILGSHELKRICTGKYPGDALIKYKDELVKKGGKYAIFQIDDGPGNHYLLAFGDSKLQDCARIKVHTHHAFQCKHEGDEWEDIWLANAFMRCVGVHLYLTDDLIDNCMSDRETPSKFTAFHYSPLALYRSEAKDTDSHT